MAFGRALRRFRPRPLDPRSVAPQKLKVVVFPICPREEMQHDVHVVHDDPGGVFLSAESEGPLPHLPPVFHDGIRHAANLPIRSSRGDDRKVGYRADSPQIESDHVLRLEVVSDPRDFNGELKAPSASHVLNYNTPSCVCQESQIRRWPVPTACPPGDKRTTGQMFVFFVIQVTADTLNRASFSSSAIAHSPKALLTHRTLQRKIVAVNPPGIEKMLELASLLAWEAAEVSLPWTNDAPASRKSDNTVVTSTDHAIQARIVHAIHGAFPDHAICAEEAVDNAADSNPETGHAAFCWVIDPLDGTRNYVSGLPCFATSIAVLEQGRPVAAAICEHNQRALYTAWAGGGAYLDGRRIRVEEPPRESDHLLGIPSTKDAPSLRVARHWLGTKGFVCRNLGATTIHLALVAAGAMTGAFARQTKLWDVAAGALLVVEAGGKITDPSGDAMLPFRLDADRQRDIPYLAAGPAMHERLLESIRSAT